MPGLRVGGLLVGLLACRLATAALPSIEESQAEPVIFVGEAKVDKRWHHGGVPQAVGVHRYQAFRANRSQAPDGGLVGWTYNHAPMLAYWKGRYWLEYLANIKEEHGEPGRTSVMWSLDGRHWSDSGVVFPVRALPEIKPPPEYFDGRDLPPIPEGTGAIMHQRMGWYVAPNDRLLVSGFYSYCPNSRLGPNRGQGMGRVVREVYEDGTYGPIYYVRYNRAAGWTEETAPWFDSYRTSPDAGFVEACEALLADKLITLQWHEENQTEDGVLAINPPRGTDIKGFNYYERDDGVLVGLWKDHTAALSADHGQTWSPLGTHPFPEAMSKVWGQRTHDGRYAIVYNHSATKRNRWPLVVVTSDDGYRFDDMLVVHGEVPPMRYQGLHKGYGPQYIRGIMPGNGTPPNDHLWLTYSVNKEDIWVASVRTPVSGAVPRHVRDDFEGGAAALDLWNLYVPRWAPVQLAEDPFDPANRCLELGDEDPYDYAKVERAFPEGGRIRVEFSLLQWEVGTAKLEVEVQGRHNERPMRLRFDAKTMGFDEGPAEPWPAPFDLRHWHRVRLDLDCAKGTYSAWIDDKLVTRDLEFAAPADAVQRIVFRTGPWRMDVRQFLLDGEPGNPGTFQEDLPGADTKVAGSRFFIDDVKTSSF